MSLIKFESIDALAEVAAEMIASLLQSSIRERGAAHLALSGGGTPRPIYEALTLQALDWTKVHVWWADERCVPRDDPESNFRMAQDALLSKVDIPEAQIHRAKGELGGKVGAADYVQQLTNAANQGDLFPRLDVVILGMGGDGHTASLFPGTMPEEELTRPARGATADYQGRPAERITLTPLIFNAARHIFFIATGQSKAEPLAATFDEKDLLNKPVQRISPLDGMIYWIVDEAAAALLSPS